MSTSGAPSSSRICANSFATCAASVASAAYARPPTACAIGSTVSRLRATTPTWNPSRAKRRTTAAPSPGPAPITTAIFDIPQLYPGTAKPQPAGHILSCHHGRPSGDPFPRLAVVGGAEDPAQCGELCGRRSEGQHGPDRRALVGGVERVGDPDAAAGHDVEAEDLVGAGERRPGGRAGAVRVTRARERSPVTRHRVAQRAVLVALEVAQVVEVLELVRVRGALGEAQVVLRGGVEPDRGDRGLVAELVHPDRRALRGGAPGQVERGAGEDHVGADRGGAQARLQRGVTAVVGQRVVAGVREGGAGHARAGGEGAEGPRIGGCLEREAG